MIQIFHWTSYICSSPGHFTEGFLCHSENVRIHLSHVPATVGSGSVVTIDWQGLVGIEGDQHDATVGVDHSGVEEPHR